jgi:sRNA-binding carbon storage regulator CsrA
MTRRTIEMSAGDSALIGGARITLVEKSGRRARIVIEAPEQVPIVHPLRNPSAHECASSSAAERAKEHHHGKHPV